MLLQPFLVQGSSIGGVKVIKLTMLNQLCAKKHKMSPVSKTHRKRNISGAVNELETYFRESCQEMDTYPLDYWKINYINYPTLANLANKLLSTPATSASVERLFSIAGKVFRPERCSLKDDTFEKLMMIKCDHQSKSK